MKKYSFRIIKMAAFYSVLGILLQAFLFNVLFAGPASEAQNLRDVKVTVKIVNVTLEQAFKILEDRTSFKFNYNNDQISLNQNVIINVEDESLYNILEVFAKDYGLTFNRINNQITVKKTHSLLENTITSEENGTIKGRVLDARTKNGIPSASVFVKRLNIGAIADNEGNFIINNVPAGKHDLSVSIVGYAKVSKTIMVQESKTISVDITLDEDAVGLNEVVVTGVAFETRRKEIPADISIMTPKAIEAKAASNFTDLLRGEIPGVFAMSNGQNDYSTFIHLRGSGMSASGNEVATILLDGIELATPSYLSTIDPKIIDRIEVIKGPHASALYGANATSGVINIVTKKGANFGLGRPKVNASFSTGYIESDFYGNSVTPSGVTPLQTATSLQFSDGQGNLSYRVGATYNTTGEWVKNYKSKALGFSGGMRFLSGNFSGELSTMWSRRKDYTTPGNNYQFDRWPALTPVGLKANQAYPNQDLIFNQLTMGMTLNYQALPNWNHKLTLGFDQNGYSMWQYEPYRLTAVDTLQARYDYLMNRVSFRYLTSYQQPISDDLYVRATVGAAYSRYHNAMTLNAGIKLDKYGEIMNSPTGTRAIVLQDRWYANYNGMLEFGYADRLFLTLSSNIQQDVHGASETYNNSPRAGLSYVQPIGDFEVRLRGEYGTATTPVDPGHVLPVSNATTVYLANSNLLPPQRGGLDAGIDFTWGNIASLTISRFDEYGKNLIQRNLISIVGTVTTYQYINVGEIAIKGWEMQGKLNFGFLDLPFLTLKANFTTSDNTISKNSTTVNAMSPTNYYMEGDRVMGVPKYSGGGNLSAAFGEWSIGIDWNFQGGVRTFDNPAWYDYRYGTAVHRDAGKTYAQFGTASTFPLVIDGQTFNVSKASQTRSYIIEWPVFWRFGLHGEYKFSDTFSAFANVSNLFNETKAESNSLNVNMGRITELGIRINY